MEPSEHLPRSHETPELRWSQLALKLTYAFLVGILVGALFCLWLSRNLGIFGGVSGVTSLPLA